MQEATALTAASEGWAGLAAVKVEAGMSVGRVAGTGAAMAPATEAAVMATAAEGEGMAAAPAVRVARAEVRAGSCRGSGWQRRSGCASSGPHRRG